MKKTTDTVLSVRLPKELDERLARAAVYLDLSKNDIARHAIRAAVRAIEQNGYKIELPVDMQVRGESTQGVATDQEFWRENDGAEGHSI